MTDDQIIAYVQSFTGEQVDGWDVMCQLLKEFQDDVKQGIVRVESKKIKVNKLQQLIENTVRKVVKENQSSKKSH